MPSAEVSDETGNHERYRHKGHSHSSEGVEVHASPTVTIWILGSDKLAVGVCVGVPAFLIVDSPEAPEHSGEGDQRAESGVEYHVGLPLVAHVASGGDLEN